MSYVNPAPSGRFTAGKRHNKLGPLMKLGPLRHATNFFSQVLHSLNHSAVTSVPPPTLQIFMALRSFEHEGFLILRNVFELAHVFTFRKVIAAHCEHPDKDCLACCRGLNSAPTRTHAHTCTCS